MKKFIYLSTILLLTTIIGCEKFLDEKPDKKLVVPSSIQDARALLNDTYTFSTSYPSSGEIASGDFYLLSESWKSLGTQLERGSYIWADDVFNDSERFNDWAQPYLTVYYANVILEALENDKIKDGSKEDKDIVSGQALFFRSYAFYHLLQLFSKAYDNATSNSDLGIPLRLSPDFNLPTTRASVEECYQQILSDTQHAVGLLPAALPDKTKPTKASAYAFLARVNLTMGKYDDAIVYADMALQFNDHLIDYSSIDESSRFSFPIFNEEVLLHTLIWTPGIFYSSTLKVDTILYSLYDDNDLRKQLFYHNNGDGSFSFKGSYNESSVLFNGFSTNELYLIRAECHARNGETAKALNNLNALLIKRWRTDSFVPLSITSPEQALSIILQERRKELVFRGIRWSDLKRLNKEPSFARTLKRSIDGLDYLLLPNDNKYVFQIPNLVIETTGIKQNPR